MSPWWWLQGANRLDSHSQKGAERARPKGTFPTSGRLPTQTMETTGLRGTHSRSKSNGLRRRQSLFSRSRPRELVTLKFSDAALDQSVRLGLAKVERALGRRMQLA